MAELCCVVVSPSPISEFVVFSEGQTSRITRLALGHTGVTDRPCFRAAVFKSPANGLSQALWPSYSAFPALNTRRVSLFFPAVARAPVRLWRSRAGPGFVAPARLTADTSQTDIAPD